MNELNKQIKIYNTAKNMRLIIWIFVLIFILLIGYLFYSISTFGERWFLTPYNPRISSAKSNIAAGSILDRSGVKLAYTSNGNRKYAENASARKAVSHVVGDTYGLTRGAESFFSKQLYGFDDNIIDRVEQAIKGNTRQGNDITLTISASLSKTIAEKISKGAAVVMNYKTGEILACVSVPGFDPTKLEDFHDDNESTILFNRATMGKYAPGSIFKVITATAVLESTISEDFEVECTGSIEIEGKTISCAGGTSHGKVNLNRAFDKSCNVYFSTVAQKLGGATLQKTAERYAFNDEFLFSDIILYKSIYEQSHDNFTLASAGFGQYDTLITPLHACLIAAAVANGGNMPVPVLLKNETSAGGSDLYTMKSKTYIAPISKSVADKLKSMMLSVVENGTGTNAAISGKKVAGKTGTAQYVDKNGEMKENAWFIGFLDDEKHPYCVSVIVENGGSGGKKAAPIAKAALSAAIKLKD